MNDILIQAETAADHPAVFKVHEAAFGCEDEARMVEGVRASGDDRVSLVAVQDQKVIGHILFSPVTITNNPNHYTVLGLAPIAVLPEAQNQSIGTKLINAGLEQCKRTNVAAVVVLGHTSYYPKFGFEPASTYDLWYNGQDMGDHFMILELVVGAVSTLSGTVTYVPAIG